MELVWLGALVVLAALSFFFWPKISNKLDDFQEDMDEAHEKVTTAVEEVVEEVEDAKEKLQATIADLPSKTELMKMTKAKIDELAAEVGIQLDRRTTKDKMVAEFQKQAKKAK